MNRKIRKKRFWSAVSFTLAAVIFLLALYVFFVSLDAKSKNEPVEFFGRSFVIVLTDSMTPEIGVGELVVIESTGHRKRSGRAERGLCQP